MDDMTQHQDIISIILSYAQRFFELLEFTLEIVEIEFINEAVCWKMKLRTCLNVYGQQCVFVYTIKKRSDY